MKYEKKKNIYIISKLISHRTLTVTLHVITD